MPNEPLSPPELLAPAGNRECLVAAIENGADAVYFGLADGFNARARAENISRETLPEIMALLHSRGVKGYLTLNTLVFSRELAELEQLARHAAACRVDAVLVQDLGAARLIRAACPQLPLHASTQMTLTSAECVAAVETLGLERVVVARELSIKEIRRMRERTRMPLEVFAHGALCVAYSGQCLTSESLGGRSANRGQCAQACRLQYDLICDEQEIDLGDRKYLLSPQDLAAYDLIPELLEAGVCCFKIEGRLKTPEYVANITRRYREAIDAAVAQQPLRFSPHEVEEMELSFSRGFSHGWLAGSDHKALVPALSSAKRGVRVGIVEKVAGNRVVVQLQRRLKAGDGVVFARDGDRDNEQGGRVFAIYRGKHRVEGEVDGERVSLAFDHQAVDLRQVAVGQELWKTDDPLLSRRLQKTFRNKHPLRKLTVTLTVTARTGEPLRLRARVRDHEISLETEEPLAAATKHPVTGEFFEQQFGRLGNTEFVLGEVRAAIDGGPLVPLSVIGKLRRELVARLRAAMLAPEPANPQPRQEDESPNHGSTLEQMRHCLHEAAGPAARAASDGPNLQVLCRSLEQLQLVLEIGERRVLVEFQDIRQYAAAVAQATARGAEIWIATPRIQKPGEHAIFQALARHQPTGILARNLAALVHFAGAGVRTVADFSLNVANELTADYLRTLGAERVTASYDLNREQLLDLAQNVPPHWLEAVIHQHMPMFHMEHCVFCAVLSPGTNRHNCGRPCDRHQVHLRDRIGMKHRLTADVGCRNTLYNATPQSSAEVVPQLLQMGLREYRIELLEQTDRAEIAEIVTLYRQLLTGERSGSEVWKHLRASNRVGVTRGTLEAPRNPLALL